MTPSASPPILNVEAPRFPPSDPSSTQTFPSKGVPSELTKALARQATRPPNVPLSKPLGVSNPDDNRFVPYPPQPPSSITVRPKFGPPQILLPNTDVTQPPRIIVDSEGVQRIDPESVVPSPEAPTDSDGAWN